jgi:hypothetical protein
VAGFFERTSARTPTAGGALAHREHAKTDVISLTDKKSRPQASTQAVRHWLAGGDAWNAMFSHARDEAAAHRGQMSLAPSAIPTGC